MPRRPLRAWGSTFLEIPLSPGPRFLGSELVEGQADARKAQLSSLFGTLIEDATLAKRLKNEPLFAQDAYTVENLDSRVLQFRQREFYTLHVWSP